jgi:O-antigen ligase
MISVQGCILFAMLMFSMVGIAPFSGSEVAADNDLSGGSVVRQVVLIALAAALAPIAYGRQRYVLAAIKTQPWMIALVAWGGISILWSAVPDVALRRWVLALLVIAMTISLCAVINDATRIHKIAMVATGLVMAVNIFAVIALPDLATQSEHRGTFWIGLHEHKNGAGLTAAISILIWFYAALRSQLKWTLLAVCAAWMVFLLGTGSTTSQFALLVAVLCTWLLSINNRYLRYCAVFLIVFFMIVGLTTIAVGLLPVERVMFTLFGDATFTGRTILWSFLISQIESHPLAGFGFGSFWGATGPGPVNAVGDEWFALAAQGHNGYLDIAATTGLIGLALALAALLAPLRTLLAANAWVAPSRRVFYAMWIFGLVHNGMETSILRGDSILWVLMMTSMAIMLGWSGGAEFAEAPPQGGFRGRMAMALARLRTTAANPSR